MTHDLTPPEQDPADEPVRYAEEVSHARRAGAASLGFMVLWAVIAVLVDTKLVYGLLPLVALGALPSLRMLLRPHPVRPHPLPGVLKGIRGGEALEALDTLPREEQRLRLLDHLDVVEGRVDRPGSPWWLHRFASVGPALGTLGWATAGIVAAAFGASAADLSACVFGTVLFGAAWWFIERERKKEQEAAQLLRERLDALDALGPGTSR